MNLRCLSFALLLSSVCGCTSENYPGPRNGDSVGSTPATSVPAREAWTSSRVQGTPEPPPPYRLEECFGGLSFYNPVCIAPLPGTEQLLVGELCGRIYSIRKDAPTEEPVLVIDLWKDLADRPPSPAHGQPPVRTDNPLPFEQLYDFTFHPDFEKNRQIFLTYLDPDAEALIRLSRLEFSSINPPKISRSSETKLLSWHGEGHNGGCVRFGPDGNLYIATGDGVMPNPPDSKDFGQDLSNLNSSVLRIDVNRQSGNKPYAIPSDNPFLGESTARPEVWAYGFRNPWRMDFSGATGALWMGDVGWESWEMVHHVVAGGNYGWPIMEGRMPLRSEVPRGPTPIIPPVKDYPRADGYSITGGVVYSGQKHEGLVGWFLYGDYRSGKAWAVDTRNLEELQHQELVRSAVRIVDFAQDSAGDVYVLDHDFTGKIYKLVSAPAKSDAEEFPRRLSETGLFSSVSELKPAKGVVPYEVIVRPWMDGAEADRLLALPGGSRVETAVVDGKEVWKFPEGAVLAKTLFYPGKEGSKPVRLETQILHYEDEIWHPYSYAWNEAQDDAVLVSPEGSNPESQAGTDWRTVSRVECLGCHRPAQGYVLGFEPSQLDHKNQLELLAGMGALSGPVPNAGKTVNLVDPHDAHADLDERARSYLHVNCGNCHNRDGGSIVFFYLTKGPSLEDMKALTPPAVGGFGLSDPRIIAPGDPYRSVVLYRMGKLGNGRMPYVGSQVVDPRGFRLLHDWIASLDVDVKVKTPPRINVAGLDALKRSGASSEQQNQGIGQLLSSTSGALALVASAHGGALSSDIQARIVKSSQKSRPEISSVFETFVPPSQRRKRLGPNIRAEDVLKVKGDAARGKLIYSSESSRCRTCHVPDSDGQPPLGPELKKIATKKYGRPEMLRHIIEPSLQIDPEFAPYLLVTTGGDVHAGLLMEKTDSELRLRNTQLETIRVPASEVVSFEKQATSLMPEKLLSDLTAQEAADLLEFLVSLEAEGQ